MTSTNRYRSLLIKYLLNELSQDETMRVEEWLGQPGDHQAYFEELKKTLALTRFHGAAGNADIDEQWNNFTRALEVTDTTTYTDHEPFEAGMPYELNQTGKLRRISKWVVSAVAASILLAVGIWWLIAGNNKTVQQVAVQPVHDSIEASVQAVLLYEKNESETVKSIVLKDGSAVRLQQKTTISFMDPFADNKRNIGLTGKAFFDVAKDKTRPFTVRSGDISTTALGTKFSITAYPADRNIRIRLFEGRIVVKSADTLRPKLTKDFYLLPGHELVYDKIAATVHILSFGTGKAMDSTYTSDDDIVLDNPVIPTNAKTTWYMFNNQPLTDVFEQFEKIYATDIEYDKKDLRGMYFIGKFNKSDSLDIILKQICRLNGLNLTKKDNKFFVTK